jgi:hypothetical protein
MDWKTIGLGALINAALTILLSMVYAPLLLLGPLIGGFFSSYLSQGFEDYAKMDKVDGAVMGAISGIIGGILIALLSILGLGAINEVIGLIFSQIGSVTGAMAITWYVIFQLSVGMSLVLGLVGGMLGVILKG